MSCCKRRHHGNTLRGSEAAGRARYLLFDSVSVGSIHRIQSQILPKGSTWGPEVKGEGLEKAIRCDRLRSRFGLLVIGSNGRQESRLHWEVVEI